MILAVLGWLGWHQVDGPTAPPAPRRQASRVFQAIQGASLRPHRDNDGDSFHLTHDGQAYEFRLYFADCPEKKRHSLNAARLADQGRYFGGLTEEQTVAVGRQAEAFTRQLLTTQPFTLYTKWHPVYDSGRYYTLVIFPDGEDLSAKLVRAGLARIHTTGTTLPDGRSTADHQRHLRQLEAAAKSARKGAWAVAR